MYALLWEKCYLFSFIEVGLCKYYVSFESRDATVKFFPPASKNLSLKYPPSLKLKKRSKFIQCLKYFHKLFYFYVFMHKLTNNNFEFFQEISKNFIAYFFFNSTTVYMHAFLILY